MAHGEKLLFAILKAPFKIGDGAPGIFKIQSYVLACVLIFLEF